MGNGIPYFIRSSRCCRGLLFSFSCVLLGVTLVVNSRSSTHVASQLLNNENDAFLEKLIPQTDVVFIVVGGGPGLPEDHGYPTWTMKRTLQAFSEFSKSSVIERNSSIFLALSAGSMNGPNVMQSDGRIIFECQHILSHLKELGVSKDRLFGDFISWDTVANGLTVRMFVESLLSQRRYSDQPLRLKLFTSDFHLERLREVLLWVLQLDPSLKPNVAVSFHVHDAYGVSLGSKKEDFDVRIAHEKRGVAQIQSLAKKITKFTQFQAYLMLGGHQGYSKYLRSESLPRSRGNENTIIYIVHS